MRELRSAFAAGCVLALNAAWWAATELYPTLGDVAAPYVLPVGLILALLLGWLWFRAVRPVAPSEFMTAGEAIRHIAHHSEWARKQRRHVTVGSPAALGPIPMRKNVPMEAIGEFSRQAQKIGTKIRVFGHRLVPSEMVEIPYTFWMANSIDMNCAFDEAQPSRTAASSPRNEPPFVDLKIERAGVLQTWPRPHALRRLIEAWPAIARRMRPRAHAADF